MIEREFVCAVLGGRDVSRPMADNVEPQLTDKDQPTTSPTQK
jgi:hypothetical protein